MPRGEFAEFVKQELRRWEQIVAMTEPPKHRSDMLHQG